PDHKRVPLKALPPYPRRKEVRPRPFDTMVRYLNKSYATGLTEDQVKGIFKRYDANGDGILNREEIRNAFASLGSRLPGFRAYRGLHHADANGDGLIDEEELKALVEYGAKVGYTIK
ncbi:hypothetical protein F2P56_012443, partial [Juglans regia]